METAIAAVAMTIVIGLAVGKLTGALIRGETNPENGDQPGIKNHRATGNRTSEET